MNLWLVGRRSADRRPGGDALQVEESAALARARGVRAEVVHDAGSARPGRGDVVHLFGIQRCHDWGDLPERARAAGARLLVTPLYHSLRRYHRHGRRGPDRLLARLLPDPDRFAGLRWGRTGVRERAARILRLADRVLLVHEGEAALLRDEIGIAVEDARAEVVPVAIPGRGPQQEPEDGGLGAFLLCAGRVEPLKDPMIVRAAASTLGLPALFAGAGAGPRHPGYARALLGGPEWIGDLPHATLLRLMGQARVHVLASWAEVVGRVTLEAALAGAAVVLSDVGFAPAMLRGCEGVFPFEPGDLAGLRSAIQGAWERGRRRDSDLVRRVRDRFTWNAVGPALLEAWSS